MDRDFDSAILDDVAHRPWPLPGGPWVMTQTWHDLLFAHWPIDTAYLRVRVPREFPLDLFDGRAWLGIVPFRMTNVAPRGVPSVPWVSEFPEVNVRTYVRVGDRPGVYFLSLDAGRAVAVHAARALLNLPYHSASISVERGADGVRYHSLRHRDARAELLAHYGPTRPVSIATDGSLEYFLTERYCLYNMDRQARPYRLDIHHPPWRLQTAHAHFMRNTMAEANGIALPLQQPVLHFVQRQDVVVWAPSRIR